MGVGDAATWVAAGNDLVAAGCGLRLTVAAGDGVLVAARRGVANGRGVGIGVVVGVADGVLVGVAVGMLMRAPADPVAPVVGSTIAAGVATVVATALGVAGLVSRPSANPQDTSINAVEAPALSQSTSRRTSILLAARRGRAVRGSGRAALMVRAAPPG